MNSEIYVDNIETLVIDLTGQSLHTQKHHGLTDG